MAATDTEHPLKLAADRALAKADELGGADRAYWSATDNGWRVPSSRPGENGGEPYRVTRTHEPRDSEPAAAGRRTGFGWAFILTCNCPASASGYAVCWHKAAVYRWWQKYRRVDGNAYKDLPAHSNANAALHETDAVDRLFARQPVVFTAPDGTQLRRLPMGEDWPDDEAEHDCPWCHAVSGEPCERGCGCPSCDTAEPELPW